MITFTPLSGGARLSKTAPLAYLLQVDDVRILLDCGSPDWCPEGLGSIESEFSTGQGQPSWGAYCKALKGYAPTIDLVLLSHGDLQHSGLYAYAYTHWGLRAATYTTLPVQAMARTASIEESESIRSQEDVDYKDETTATHAAEDRSLVGGNFDRKFVASIEEVREAYDAVNTLRYSQPAHLQGKCQGLTITAFNAGHTLGGTMWKVRSPSAGTILYAVDLNHLRERHLDGTVLLRGAGTGGVYETLARPDLFITDADRVNNISCRKKDRDAQLIDTVTSTLSSRHSVLMPCDSSTRLLELLVLLDQHWSYSRPKFPICLVSRTGREMLTFVRSMMEWLGGTISKEDVGEEGGDGHNRRRRDDNNDDEALGALALRFRHLEFFTTPQALLHTYSSKDPKLILAVPISLSHGASRIIFSEFASVPDNVVLLTSQGEEGTLGRALFNMWNNEQRDEDKWNKGKLGRNVMLDKTLTLTMKSKIPLQGVELEEYLRRERAVKEREAAEEVARARTQRMLEADEIDSDSDDSDEEEAVEHTLGDESMDVTEDGVASTSVFAEPGVGHGRRRGRKDADIGDWGFETEDGSMKQMLSYDIYLKGNVSKTTSFFKAAGVQQQKFRMFPYVERKRRVDSYGEVLDVGMWLRKGKIFEEEAESEESKEAKRRKDAEENARKVSAEPPSKYISLDVEVQLACRLLFVDMEGLNDGRAIKKIAAHVNPRKMITIHASLEDAQSLIEACGAVRALTKDIYAPDIGDSVQIGQHTNSYSISLSEELLASVKMSNFEDNEVGFVQGSIASLASSTIPILEPISNLPMRDENTPVTVAPPLKPTRLGSRVATKLPQSTMIGDLKLTALKARLAKLGVQTEFAGEGVLLCRGNQLEDNATDSIVAVRKMGDGKVELDGTVTDVYYTVRRAIYELHALIAA